jgi:hypothetical protein
MDESVERQRVEQAFRDHRVLAGSDAERERDPELAAIALAILVEEVLEVTLSDDELAPGALDEPATVAEVIGRRRGGS